MAYLSYYVVLLIAIYKEEDSDDDSGGVGYFFPFLFSTRATLDLGASFSFNILAIIDSCNPIVEINLLAYLKVPKYAKWLYYG